MASTSEAYTCRSVALPELSCSSSSTGWISTTTEEAVSRCTATIQLSSSAKIRAGCPSYSPIAECRNSCKPPSVAGPCSHWETAAATPALSGVNPRLSPQRACARAAASASAEDCLWERTAAIIPKTMPTTATTAATINMITGTDNIHFPYLRALLSINRTVFCPISELLTCSTMILTTRNTSIPLVR